MSYDHHISEGTPAGDRYEFQLTRGTMRLQVHEAAMPLNDLLSMAERENPKRAFLFVSHLLGRHIPVPARSHRHMLDQLALRTFGAGLDPNMDVLVMGYAETAVGLGAGVHDALRAGMGRGVACYLPTTRHPGTDPVWFSFSEDHSHATGHSVLIPHEDEARRIAQTAKTLVLVDDEVTTGMTFMNLLSAAAGVGRHFERIILVTMTDWSDGAVAARVAEALPGNPEVSIVSLIRGAWDWTPNAFAAPVSIPVSARRLMTEGVDAAAGRWRGGIVGATRVVQPETLRLDCEKCNYGKGTLVIGMGEFVWQPFRLAEELTAAGINASFLATTRSPVLQGDTIRHKAVFADHYGLGLPMYLHNVRPADWGQIIIMSESAGADGLDIALIDYLRNFILLSPSGKTTQYIEGRAAQ